MNDNYVMRDLGYKRTPTNALYLVTMENGDIYSVPVQAIVDSRDENYADEKNHRLGYEQHELE